MSGREAGSTDSSSQEPKLHGFSFLSPHFLYCARKIPAYFRGNKGCHAAGPRHRRAQGYFDPRPPGMAVAGSSVANGRPVRPGRTWCASGQAPVSFSRSSAVRRFVLASPQERPSLLRCSSWRMIQDGKTQHPEPRTPAKDRRFNQKLYPYDFLYLHQHKSNFLNKRKQKDVETILQKRTWLV